MVNLVLRETGRTVETGRYGSRRKVTLKTYNAFADEGTIIGVVSLDMATFERSTRGRMYVNSRWQSPRWFYYVGERWSGRRSIDYTTRKAAVDALVAECERRTVSAQNETHQPTSTENKTAA